MTDPNRPDPGSESQAEGDRDDIRPQDRGKGPGTDTADREEPAEGGRDESDDD